MTNRGLKHVLCQYFTWTLSPSLFILSVFLLTFLHYFSVLMDPFSLLNISEVHSVFGSGVME